MLSLSITDNGGMLSLLLRPPTQVLLLMIAHSEFLAGKGAGGGGGMSAALRDEMVAVARPPHPPCSDSPQISILVLARARLGFFKALKHGC